MPPFKSVLLIGDLHAPRVTQLRLFLERRTTVWAFDYPQQAIAAANDEQAIDLILLAPSVRHAWQEDGLRALMAEWPLALAVMLVDSPLEGETRSGRPWPGLLRIYWTQFEPQWELAERWQDETRRASRRDEDRPLLRWRPPTELPEERVVTGPWPDRTEYVQGSIGHVWIHASRRENRETLTDVCQVDGWQVICVPPDPSWSRGQVAVVLYDAMGHVDGRRRELEYIAQLAHGVPIVMLLDFPRYDEILAAEALGVVRVLGKPYRVEELGESLRRAVPRVGS